MVRFAPTVSPQDGHVLLENPQLWAHLAHCSRRRPLTSGSAASVRKLSWGGPPQLGQRRPPRGAGSLAQATPTAAASAAASPASGPRSADRARYRSTEASSAPASHAVSSSGPAARRSSAGTSANTLASGGGPYATDTSTTRGSTCSAAHPASASGAGASHTGASRTGGAGHVDSHTSSSAR